MLLAAVMLFTVAFAVACKKDNKDKKEDDPNIPIDPVVTSELISISVDTSNLKKEYLVGEEFSSEGLVVKASIKKSDAQTAEEKTLSASEYILDSSAYVKDNAGTYTIKVSYTLEKVTKEASFDVTVRKYNFAGLEVKWIGNTDTYTLNSDIQSATIDISKIEVREVDNNGIVINELVTDYDLELYNGNEKIEIGDTTKIRVNKGGTYQLWASKPSTKVDGYTLRGFVRVYVINDIKSLEVDTTVTTSVFEQPAGREDLMSSTWQYKLTYANGQIEQLTASDVVIENLYPKISGNGTAKITYNTVNAKGVPVSKTCNVPFNITGKYSPDMIIFNASTMELGTYNTVLTDSFTATKGDETELISPDELGKIEILSSTDGDVQVIDGGLTMDGLSLSKILDLRGKGDAVKRSIKINLVGAAAVTVYAVSGSTANERTLALYDDTYFPIDESFKVSKTAKHTFMIDKAGEYYLGSLSGGIRVYYILVEYE